VLPVNHTRCESPHARAAWWSSPGARLLGTVAERKVYNIVHLIYRAKNYEGNWSRSCGNENWEFDKQGLMRQWIASNFRQ
jgi:nuclear transport factor 2 (NTF2) superfamily protein